MLNHYASCKTVITSEIRNTETADPDNEFNDSTSFILIYLHH